MNVKMTPEMKAAVDKFVVVVNAQMEAHTELHFPSQKIPPDLELDEGSKYVRVWRRYNMQAVSNDRTAYCFIDKTTGDIFKAATWRAPAKHARGNVLSCDYLDTAGPYGMKYLRGSAGYAFVKGDRSPLDVVKDMLLEDRVPEAVATLRELVKNGNAFNESA